jgi:hypothetical protein
MLYADLRRVGECLPLPATGFDEPFSATPSAGTPRNAPVQARVYAGDNILYRVDLDFPGDM